MDVPHVPQYTKVRTLPQHSAASARDLLYVPLEMIFKSYLIPTPLKSLKAKCVSIAGS